MWCLSVWELITSFHFQRSEIELSRVRNFRKVLFPQAIEKGKRCNQGSHKFVHNMETCIRPVIEYASTGFYNLLPSNLSDELDVLERRAMRIIFPYATYSEALELAVASLEKLFDWRQAQTIKMLQSVKFLPEPKKLV